MENSPGRSQSNSNEGPSDGTESRLEVTLEVLTPMEIVAVNRYLWSLSAGKAQSRYQCGEPDQGTDDTIERYTAAVTDAITRLPARNYELGRAVFDLMANSPAVEDRLSVATDLLAAVRADQNFGRRLFDQVLRDPDPQVRERAYEMLSMQAEADEQAGDATRLTSAEVSALGEAYGEAEFGIGIFHLGEVALRRLIQEHRTGSS